MWVDGYLGGGGHCYRIFAKHVELFPRVLAKTMKVGVNLRYCNSVLQLVSVLPVPELGGTYRIINNVFNFYELSRTPLR